MTYEAARHTTPFQLATLLALLRSGEQSAGLAFGRIRQGLSPGLLALASPVLNDLIADERRHDQMLEQLCAHLPYVRVCDAQTRRFFHGLESREPRIHLARVASLDACVCQVLTRALALPGIPQGEPLTAIVLSNIRADEARHVKISRALARLQGTPDTQLRVVDLEVRQRFAALLETRTAAFEGLGIDMPNLIAAIRRDH